MLALSIAGTSLFLLLAGLALLIAVGADTIGQRFRIPDLIWLILFGIVVGPVLGWIGRSAILGVAPVVGTAVLVVILFDAGLDLRAAVLRPLLASAVAFSVVTYFASVAIATVLADLFLFPDDPLLSLFFGAALGATSGAVAIPIANRMGLASALRGFVHLDAAIEDAVAIVVTSILLLLVAPGGGASSLDVILVVTLPIPVGIVVGVAGGIVWLLTLSRWQRRAYASLATLGFVLAIYSVAEALHGSGILAALLVGITIANAPLLHRLARWIRVIDVHESLREVQTDLAFMLRALFLFFLGALVELRNPGLLPLLDIGVLSLVLLALRYGFASILAGRHRIEFAWSSVIGGVGGRGLTSAVLLLLPLGIVAGADRLFLPGVLTIVGTDVVMTLWISLAPVPKDPPRGPGPTTGVRPWSVLEEAATNDDGRPPLPAVGPRGRPPETV
jgi:cell volume regulation protein A